MLQSECALSERGFDDAAVVLAGRLGLAVVPDHEMAEERALDQIRNILEWLRAQEVDRVGVDLVGKEPDAFLDRCSRALVLLLGGGIRENDAASS